MTPHAPSVLLPIGVAFSVTLETYGKGIAIVSNLTGVHKIFNESKPKNMNTPTLQKTLSNPARIFQEILLDLIIKSLASALYKCFIMHLIQR